MERNYVLGNQVIFDVLKREIVACDHVVNLGGREAAILKLLCERSNHILSKDEIHEQVWGRVLVSETSLTKAISNLRKSLTLFNELACEIKTVPKEGYMLILDGEAIDQLSSEEIPTLAIKSIVSSTKSAIHPSYISAKNEAINAPVKGSFWFTMLFSAALLASIITISIMLFLK
ncbi:winged helix-turn-helix domain-containing protein [Vibrio sagamiensis]|uniref:Transcriptional regulator n=1 Tax=Vibrio sagamiensis NBRC 104589 TaxID=1219064 RepID=A0A511QLR7_9VIBR|nr:winged helix-turn-helix domain-containing protein [Vibrio sagamiensis]GEM77462.1 transcriptional regulator [Vibrio sagamiensis NBRC 104589]